MKRPAVLYQAPHENRLKNGMLRPLSFVREARWFFKPEPGAYYRSEFRSEDTEFGLRLLRSERGYGMNLPPAVYHSTPESRIQMTVSGLVVRQYACKCSGIGETP
jgi:hypothetical protein